MRMENHTDNALDEALEWLKGFDVVNLEICFSGGNDEGGIDERRAITSTGDEVDIPDSNAYLIRRWNQESQDYGKEAWFVGWGNNDRAASSEEIKIAQYHQTLNAPIFDKYHSFAGAFYVNGTLVWDVLRKTCEMHGTETIEVDREF